MAVSKELQILITAKDEASKKLGALGDSLGKTFKVASAVVASAGLALGAFGVASIKAFSDSQVQMARFDATLKNVSGTTDEMRQKLLDTAQASRKLGFDGEDTAEVLAKFYQRTKSVTEAIKLNTIAQDLSRAKGIELAEAGNLINQVLSGNGKVLKQYGIELNDTLTPLQALGQLQEQVAGQGEAFANTIAGKMTNLSKIFGDLKEKIGEALVGLGVGGVLDGVIAMLERIEKIDFAGTFNSWRSSIVGFGEELNAQTGIIDFFRAVGQTLVDFFNTYMKPSWDGLVQTIKDNKEMILQLVGGFGKYIAVIAGGALIAGMTALVVIFETISVAIKGVKWLIDSLSSAFQVLYEWVGKMIQRLKELADAVANSGIGKIANSVGGSVKSAFGKVKSLFVNDAVISPSGQVISTHPDDYLIATKTPESLGGGVVVNINGGYYLSEDVAEQIGDQIMKKLGFNTIVA